MRRTELIMGMPSTVEIIDGASSETDIEKIFGYFRSIDERAEPPTRGCGLPVHDWGDAFKCLGGQQA